MASKRLGSPFRDSSEATKKPKIDVSASNATSISSYITPDTATFPDEVDQDTPLAPTSVDPPELTIATEQSTDTTGNLRIRIPPNEPVTRISEPTPLASALPPQIITNAPRRFTIEECTDPETGIVSRPADYTFHRPIATLWVVIEHWHPQEPSEGEKAMVKILGIFTTAAEANGHAEEHAGALNQVTTDGICAEPDEDDDRVSEAMSPESVMERRLEFFRGLYERTEEEEREDGGKKWTVYWGHVTEVWVERREVFLTKEDAGFFTPLPVLGYDSRDD